jgi:hypothetical protein
MRPTAGQLHSADGWHAVLELVVARYRGTVMRLYFRAMPPSPPRKSCMEP